MYLSNAKKLATKRFEIAFVEFFRLYVVSRTRSLSLNFVFFWLFGFYPNILLITIVDRIRRAFYRRMVCVVVRANEILQSVFSSVFKSKITPEFRLQRLYKTLDDARFDVEIVCVEMLYVVFL